MDRSGTQIRIVRSEEQVASLRPSMDHPTPRTEERWAERRSLVFKEEKLGRVIERELKEVLMCAETVDLLVDAVGDGG